ncbi:zinc finger protein 567-like isoform X2 [Lampris incognitus]|uniref:zinc finger protein 567-like isoform X2 n=1 Tax=Lampris incognitus TaxID=2546036 RepID=UPI0024B5711D|nr:zinc finger protein 567-like isoform X2 [Lampris incognitus]
MEFLKIEQVVVGGERMATSNDIKSEPLSPAPLQPFQHDSLQCFQCFITFCNSKAKERHVRKCHREEYKQQLQQSDTVFTCYVCDRSFLSSEELTQHQASHSTEDKPFRCANCQGSFRTFSELMTHRRQECTERQYVCKDCGMVFRSPTRLRTHRITLHPQPVEEADDDSKTYRCGKCNLGFQMEAELLQHQELFADTQNCDIRPPAKKRGRPPKKVAEKETTNDKRSKEADEGGAKIEEGNKESLTKGTKQRGQPPKEQQQQPQTDLKIPCPENDCDLIFSSVTALRAHKRDKHGPPPPPRKAHPCTECEESYARPEQLKAHMARAHGYNRHTCPTCGKSFGREGNLKAHQKTHAEGEEATDKEKR